MIIDNLVVFFVNNEKGLDVHMNIYIIDKK